MKILSWSYYGRRGVLVDSPMLIEIQVRHGWGWFSWAYTYVGREKTWWRKKDTLFFRRTPKRIARKLTHYYRNTLQLERSPS